MRQVRWKVQDPSPSPSGTAPLYVDEVYNDAINFAISKLNMDLRNLIDFTPLPPWTVETLPAQLEFLLIKLATIEMCQIRGGEGAGETGSGVSYTGVTSIEVPDLTVDAGNNSAVGPVYWRHLLDRLQREYDGEVGRLVDGKSPPYLGQIRVVDTLVYNVLTKGMDDEALDKGPDATTMTGTYTDTTLVLTWVPVFIKDFSYYKVVHDYPDGTSETLFTESDNHKDTATTTTTLSVGDHTFTHYVVNGNNLQASGEAVVITVPEP